MEMKLSLICAKTIVTGSLLAATAASSTSIIIAAEVTSKVALFILSYFLAGSLIGAIAAARDENSNCLSAYVKNLPLRICSTTLGPICVILQKIFTSAIRPLGKTVAHEISKWVLNQQLEQK